VDILDHARQRERPAQQPVPAVVPQAEAREAPALWFRVYPETDLELIKAEVHPTDKELKDWEDSQPWEAAERG
jgi:hypothetical protein